MNVNEAKKKFAMHCATIFCSIHPMPATGTFLFHHIELSVHKFDAQIDIYSIETHNFLVSCSAVIPLSLCICCFFLCLCFFLPFWLFICILISAEAYLLLSLSLLSPCFIFYARTMRFILVRCRAFFICWSELIAKHMKDEKCLRFE